MARIPRYEQLARELDEQVQRLRNIKPSSSEIDEERFEHDVATVEMSLNAISSRRVRQGNCKHDNVQRRETRRARFAGYTNRRMISPAFWRETCLSCGKIVARGSTPIDP